MAGSDWNGTGDDPSVLSPDGRHLCIHWPNCFSGYAHNIGYDTLVDGGYVHTCDSLFRTGQESGVYSTHCWHTLYGYDGVFRHESSFWSIRVEGSP